jgi:hypothetical protein
MSPGLLRFLERHRERLDADVARRQERLLARRRSPIPLVPLWFVSVVVLGGSLLLRSIRYVTRSSAPPDGLRATPTCARGTHDPR